MGVSLLLHHELYAAGHRSAWFEFFLTMLITSELKDRQLFASSQQEIPDQTQVCMLVPYGR